MTTVDTSVQSVSGSYGYYKGTLEVTITAAEPTYYTFRAVGVTKMMEAASYGVQTVLSGAVSGTASGYTDSASYGSYANVPGTSITKTLKVARTHSKQTKKFTIQSKGVTVSGRGAAYSSTGTKSISVEVPALASRTIAYNANVPSDETYTGSTASQTKWYGEALTLRANGFTRPGYTFKNWYTNASGSGGTAYAAGASYNDNSTSTSTVTLYAQWQENTALLTYDANGGVGAPEAQTMRYSQAANITTAAPTRDRYYLSSWNTQPDGTGTTYQPGAELKQADAEPVATTLYAQWALAYVPPTLTNLKAVRCNSGGEPRDDGTDIKLTFDYTLGDAPSFSTANLKFRASGDATYTTRGLTIGTEVLFDDGDGSTIALGTFAAGTSFSIILELTSDDTEAVTISSSTSVPTAFYTVDLGAGGKTIGVGQAAASSPARPVGQMDIAMDVNFHGNVTGAGGADLPVTTGLLKGDGYGGAAAAIAGTDYPSVASTNTLLAGDGNGNAIAADPSSLFELEQYVIIDGVSTANNGVAEATVTKTKSGYYPLAIAGWTSNNRYPNVYGCRLTAQSVGSASIFCGASNFSGSTRTLTVSAVVLWVKVS